MWFLGKRPLFVVVAVGVMIAFSDSYSTVHSVSKDGTGDFYTIQSAVNSSSPGDTIQIGSGRYDDFHSLVTPGWTSEVVVNVVVDSLFFIGSGIEETVIGPEEMYYIGGTIEPMAVACLGEFSARFQDLRFENADNCIYWVQGSIEVVNCKFSGYKIGVSSWAEGGVVVRGCLFFSNLSLAAGVVLWPPCGPTVISGTSFYGPFVNEKAISANGIPDVVVSDCHFSCRAGVSLSGSTGQVVGCTSSASVVLGVFVTDGASALLSGNQLHGVGSSLYVNSYGSVSGERNVFSGGAQVATVYLGSYSSASLNRNHIFTDGALVVECSNPIGDVIVHDLTGNYWGTPDSTLISSQILDMNDDPSIRSLVNISPISDSPVSSTDESFGSFKAMFR